ncbi:MAG: hypothetical protein EBR02_01005 [Alphaproteobacteria bacterium]|nr:hypothetical protein [Alphaproteobacteria bacterium]
MANDVQTLSEKLIKQRHIGVRGTKILKHRALRRMPLSSAALQTAILLPLLLDIILWFNFDTIAAFWTNIINFWMDKMNLGYSAAHFDMTVLRRTIAIPYPDLPTLYPTTAFVIENLIVSLVLALVTFVIPRVNMPAIYLLRASILIHCTSIAYFLISPNSFPYDIGNYVSGMLALGQYLLFIIPPLMGLLFYVLDFPLWRKMVVTALMLGFFIILFPLQYLLYAMMLASWTMLFMPLLYIMFGPLLNTLMFVCWYSWAMTWRGKITN